MANSQIDPSSIQKKFLLLEINTTTKFLLFWINYIGGGYLFDD